VAVRVLPDRCWPKLAAGVIAVPLAGSLRAAPPDLLTFLSSARAPIALSTGWPISCGSPVPAWAGWLRQKMASGARWSRPCLRQKHVQTGFVPGQAVRVQT
jgi:hypothetical protein